MHDGTCASTSVTRVRSRTCATGPGTAERPPARGADGRSGVHRADVFDYGIMPGGGFPPGPPPLRRVHGHSTRTASPILPQPRHRPVSLRNQVTGHAFV